MRHKRHFATGIRNVEAIPPADTCPSEADPWHIPPDMCSPNLTSGNRNSGLSRWIDKFGSFQSSRSIFSKRALGRGIPGALPNSTIHIYISHNRLFLLFLLPDLRIFAPNKDELF